MFEYYEHYIFLISGALMNAATMNVINDVPLHEQPLFQWLQWHMEKNNQKGETSTPSYDSGE